jgi:hypothetical protein
LKLLYKPPKSEPQAILSINGQAFVPFLSCSLIFSISFIWTKRRKGSVAEIEHVALEFSRGFFFLFERERETSEAR